MRVRILPSIPGLCLLAVLVTVAPSRAQVPSDSAVVGARVACADGTAAGFACQNVDLLSYLPISAIGGTRTVTPSGDTLGVTLNDIWGWTDPVTGREYALVGRSDGTAFVDISDPVNPVYLGLLPTHTRPATWRDIKTHENFAYVVADNAGNHGMQVFDLTQLRNVAEPPVTFEETAHYGRFQQAHNVVINEETGFAYVVGISGPQTAPCGPGLHMVDVRQPASPTYAGCFADVRTGRRRTGYTHDAQCVLYRGPDEAYRGREICFGSNETALSIADVTDKSAPVAISASFDTTFMYIHQGWLTEDQRYFLQGDELDELAGVATRTRTLVWDVTDLDDPELVLQYLGTTPAIDHNQYVVDHFSFQANYKAGLRILDVSDVLAPVEIAFFDTYPLEDTVGFEGAWSNYPFFESGTVVVSSIREGLFVLKPTGPVNVAAEGRAELPGGFALAPAYPNPFNPQTTVTLEVDRTQHVRLVVYDALGRAVSVLHDGLLRAGSGHAFTFEAGGLASGVYWVRARGEHHAAAQSLLLLK